MTKAYLSEVTAVVFLGRGRDFSRGRSVNCVKKNHNPPWEIDQPQQRKRKKRTASHRLGIDSLYAGSPVRRQMMQAYNQTQKLSQSR